MPQPRIDMRVIKRGVEAVREYVRPGDSPLHEAMDELIDELDDRDDGAAILIALTKQEADVALAGLRSIQREYDQGRLRLTVSRIAALDGAINEVDSAIRGVVVQA